FIYLFIYLFIFYLLFRSKHCLSHTLLLLLGCWTADGAHNDSEAGSVTELAPVASSRYILAKEGSSTLIECNVTEVQEDVRWYNSKGLLLGEEEGGKWQIQERGALNISVVSFEDRGRYTCVASTGIGLTRNYTVILRVAYTNSGLGLYFVIVCLVAFAITMVLNVAPLMMHLLTQTYWTRCYLACVKVPCPTHSEPMCDTTLERILSLFIERHCSLKRSIMAHKDYRVCVL
uniref:Microfibril-associated glycoprotein 3 n=1 Tax=Xiphophorus maculatus TaxID=8083 RepID=A0A3B5QT54_XIPMA